MSICYTSILYRFGASTETNGGFKRLVSPEFSQVMILYTAQSLSLRTVEASEASDVQWVKYTNECDLQRDRFVAWYRVTHLLIST